MVYPIIAPFIMYSLCTGATTGLLLNFVGTDVMPISNSGDFQIRIQAPQGSRIENRTNCQSNYRGYQSEDS